MKVLIREALYTEFNILLPLYFKFYKELRMKQGWKIHDINYYRSDVEAILKRDKVFIAYLDGDAAGFVRISRRDEAYWIEEIYVDRDYRGLGIGRMLINKAEDYIKSRGESAYVMVLPQDNDAIKFWFKMGYDVLNTIELVKDFRESRIETGYRIVSILGYPLKLVRWRYEEYSSEEREYLEIVDKFYRMGGTRKKYFEIVAKALRKYLDQYND